MVSEELKQALKRAAKKLFESDVEPELTRPEEQFGDYSTNIALQLAKKAAKSPQEIARTLIRELNSLLGVQDVTIAGPGFINFKLTDEALAKAAFAATELPKPNQGQEILVEFGDPNPFKEMHIGHLYSYIVGDSISRLLESSGASVKRLSYHGDVGRQVAQAIWGMQQAAGSDDISLGQAYAAGAKAYEENADARAEIDALNQHIYKQDDPAVNETHREGVKLSFEHFDKILNMLSISTDNRYLESQSTPVGLELVKQNIGRVFKESEGAVVYEGEKAGLHTRVFVTSKGLPTYETKDLGLVILKDKDYPGAARSIVITANEQSEYFKVMLAALREVNPGLAKKTTHLSHGFVSLSTGKMSSREGNVFAAMDLLLQVKAAVHEQYPDSAIKKEVTFGAVKYVFSKHRLGSDIVLDINESVSLEGNSGPYLQYAHARACSVLAKAADQPASEIKDLDENERRLARKISEYPEVVEKAVNELMPHHVSTYLYELAQNFNQFYEANRVIGSGREINRLALVRQYAAVLKSGLSLLNISAPEKM